MSNFNSDLPVIEISPGELDCLFDESKLEIERTEEQQCIPVHRGRKASSRPVPKLELKGEVKAEVKVPRRHMICRPPDESNLAG